ncbi:uncharacterized protein BDR25DRAFT_351517 [Lindgomyces ingoldianus]|uniref:Uncharacterized protein n=1 Tax=Lindgomyces ingoldianus TaxID=673940 RepID=A0ACB6R6Z5_9PLEO|nr:uncharacterized protein BDR25DRAFT_351517 [Lindgomyces ingoldianus]KAF2475034.1 hypothetical protein BDR25DRAFT_351517 [Lindgomyces ingoldianus]
MKNFLRQETDSAPMGLENLVDQFILAAESDCDGPCDGLTRQTNIRPNPLRVKSKVLGKILDVQLDLASALASFSGLISYSTSFHATKHHGFQVLTTVLNFVALCELWELPDYGQTAPQLGRLRILAGSCKGKLKNSPQFFLRPKGHLVEGVQYRCNFSACRVYDAARARCTVKEFMRSGKRQPAWSDYRNLVRKKAELRIDMRERKTGGEEHSTGAFDLAERISWRTRRTTAYAKPLPRINGGGKRYLECIIQTPRGTVYDHPRCNIRWIDNGLHRTGLAQKRETKCEHPAASRIQQSFCVPLVMYHQLRPSHPLQCTSVVGLITFGDSPKSGFTFDGISKSLVTRLNSAAPYLHCGASILGQKCTTNSPFPGRKSALRGKRHFVDQLSWPPRNQFWIDDTACLHRWPLTGAEVCQDILQTRLDESPKRVFLLHLLIRLGFTFFGVGLNRSCELIRRSAKRLQPDFEKFHILIPWYVLAALVTDIPRLLVSWVIYQNYDDNLPKECLPQSPRQVLDPLFPHGAKKLGSTTHNQLLCLVNAWSISSSFDIASYNGICDYQNRPCKWTERLPTTFPWHSLAFMTRRCICLISIEGLYFRPPAFLVSQPRADLKPGPPHSSQHRPSSTSPRLSLLANLSSHFSALHGYQTRQIKAEICLVGFQLEMTQHRGSWIATNVEIPWTWACLARGQPSSLTLIGHFCAYHRDSRIEHRLLRREVQPTSDAWQRTKETTKRLAITVLPYLHSAIAYFVKHHILQAAELDDLKAKTAMRPFSRILAPRCSTIHP